MFPCQELTWVKSSVAMTKLVLVSDVMSLFYSNCEQELPSSRKLCYHLLRGEDEDTRVSYPDAYTSSKEKAIATGHRATRWN